MIRHPIRALNDGLPDKRDRPALFDGDRALSHGELVAKVEAAAADLIARGVVFIEIALLLAISGSTYQARDPPGMKEALDALQNLPAGWLILMVMALGLIAFSAYSLSEAFWRKINMDVPGVART